MPLVVDRMKSNGTYWDRDANEQIQGYLVPLISSQREDYFVTSVDVPLVKAAKRVPVPQDNGTAVYRSTHDVIAELAEQLAVLGENLDAVVVAVADIEIALGIHRQAVWHAELARTGTRGAPLLDELAIGIELGVGIHDEVADSNGVIQADTLGRAVSDTEVG